MSTGGLSVRALAADGMPSTALQWIEMQAAPAEEGSNAGRGANSSVTVNTRTNDFVRLVKDPLNLISVLGPARSGKSTLMNLLAGSKSELFATSSGSTTFTKGVYIPTKIMTLPEFSALEGEAVIDASKSNVKVSFVDTEGQGAVGKMYDLNLFTPALLCSKAVIYNRTGGLLTDDILKDLGMMTQAGQRLSSGESNGRMSGDADGGAKNTMKKPQFGHLFILFNRFQLNADTKIETLRSVLLDTESAGNDAAAKERNEIRKLLNSSFASVTVYLLPDLLKGEVRDEMQDNPSRFITIDDFRPKYLEYFKVFRTSLAKALVEPHSLVPGSDLTGGAMADFMPRFADAINAQEPLNVPSLFETSRNDAINRALTKLKADFTINLDKFAQQDGKPTADLSRTIDTEVSLQLRDMELSLSYMPPEVLKKLDTDAKDVLKPIKDNTLVVNFLKLQSTAAMRLRAVTSCLENTMRTTFPPEKLAVSKASLDNAWNTLQTTIAGKFEADCTSLDPKCAPENWHQEIIKAFDAQKTVLDAGYSSYWSSFVDNTSATVMADLRTSLENLAKNTAAGDSAAWQSGQLTAVDGAKIAFKTIISRDYLGPDASAVRQAFDAEVDSTAKTRQALWAKHDQDVLDELNRKLKKQQAVYETRLSDSLLPERQPPAFEVVIDPKIERGALEAFITSNKISTRVGQDALDTFDDHVSRTKRDFRKTWLDADGQWKAHQLQLEPLRLERIARIHDEQKRLEDALKEQEEDRHLWASNTFDDWLESQILVRKQLWLDAFEASMNNISLAPKGTSVALISEACVAANNILTSAMQRFNENHRPLRPGSLADLRLQNLDAELQATEARYKKNKLTQFDELATLYNRALLSKIVTPIVEKTMSDKESYRDTLSLDKAMEQAYSDFASGATKPLAFPDSEDHVKQWENFRKRAYEGLAENVRRNGMATSLNGKEMMPRALQVKILENIKDDCANLANALGFSWIASDVFDGGPVEDSDQAAKNANDTDVDTSKTRKFSFYNRGGHQGWWQDRYTNMVFSDWSLEQSDYILGTPVFTEIKPTMVFSQVYPAEKNDRPATVNGSFTDTTTVTNSNSFEGSIGTKYSEASKAGGIIFGEATVTLEATFGAKFGKTWGNSSAKSFQVGGSSTVTLPSGRINTVTSVGFDQQCTVPYTAKFKFAPTLSYTHGFVAAGGRMLKKEWFDKNKSENRVYKDFNVGRTDQLYEKMNANADPWDWTRFRNDSWGNYLPQSLADDSRYTFYVRGKWEGLTGRMIISTVTPGSTSYNLVP